MARVANAQLPVHVTNGRRDMDCGVMPILVDPGEIVTPMFRRIDLSPAGKIERSI
jgi:hypothetical protein